MPRTCLINLANHWLYKAFRSVQNECRDISTPQPTLLDQVRSIIPLRHHSIRTQEAYLNVIRRFDSERGALGTALPLRRSIAYRVAAHLLEDSYDIRTTEELLGHFRPLYDHGLYARLKSAWEASRKSA